MSDFQSVERLDGIRFSWNDLWPSNRLDSTRLVVPLGCIYSPLANATAMPAILDYEPIFCNGCRGVLNPYIDVNFEKKVWTCPMCRSVNSFSPHYSKNISEISFPIEMISRFTTVEYVMRTIPLLHPVFVFVIDLTIDDEDFGHLYEAFIKVLHMLPAASLVGLITFGSTIQVHELGFPYCSKSYLFNGNKIYCRERIAKVLHLIPSDPAGGSSSHFHNQNFHEKEGIACSKSIGRRSDRFLVPVEDGTSVISNLVHDLRKCNATASQRKVDAADESELRCHGEALHIALALLEISSDIDNVSHWPGTMHGSQHSNAHNASPSSSLPSTSTSTTSHSSDAISGRTGSRVMLFSGGPPTLGRGAVGCSLGIEASKSQQDLLQLNSEASSFYMGLAKRAIKISAAMDIYACALGEVGLVEMHGLTEVTGGRIIFTDSFDSPVFIKSMRNSFSAASEMYGQESHIQQQQHQHHRNYEDSSQSACAKQQKHSRSGGAGADTGGRSSVYDTSRNPLARKNHQYGARVEVIPCRDLQVAGAVGPCASLRQRGPTVAETQIGIGGTNAWYLGSLDPDTSIAFFFEPNQNPPPLPRAEKRTLQQSRRRYIQFLTRYRTYVGGQCRDILRVTTIARKSQPTDVDKTPAEVTQISQMFDQDAACVLMARLAVHKCAMGEPLLQVLQWLDRSLVRFLSKFAEYKSGNLASFRMTPQISKFPAFLYHLRRSQFLLNSNISADWQCYYRVGLLRARIHDALNMVQPSLVVFSFFNPPESVSLTKIADTPISPETILLLDNFFHLIIFYGESIVAWKEQGYQLNEEHVSFRGLLEAPKKFAQELLRVRVPAPRVLECDQRDSKPPCFIVPPSLTASTSTAAVGGRTLLPINTEATFLTFMDQLVRIVVIG